MHAMHSIAIPQEAKRHNVHTMQAFLHSVQVMQENLHRRNREETGGPLPQTPTRRNSKQHRCVQTSCTPPLEHFFHYPHPSITTSSKMVVWLLNIAIRTPPSLEATLWSKGHQSQAQRSLIERHVEQDHWHWNKKNCYWGIGKKLSEKNIDHFFYLCSFETGFCFDQWRMEYRSQAWHHFMSKLCRSWFARSEGFQRVIPSWCCRKCFDIGSKIAWFLCEHRTGEWEVGETFLKWFIIHEDKIEFL